MYGSVAIAYGDAVGIGCSQRQDGTEHRHTHIDRFILYTLFQTRRQQRHQRVDELHPLGFLTIQLVIVDIIV